MRNGVSCLLITVFRIDQYIPNENNLIGFEGCWERTPITCSTACTSFTPGLWLCSSRIRSCSWSGPRGSKGTEWLPGLSIAEHKMWRSSPCASLDDLLIAFIEGNLWLLPLCLYSATTATQDPKIYHGNCSLPHPLYLFERPVVPPW